MKKILVIGGGAMGSAFTIPCLENKSKVTITEPYSKTFIRNLSSKNKFQTLERNKKIMNYQNTYQLKEKNILKNNLSITTILTLMEEKVVIIYTILTI